MGCESPRRSEFVPQRAQEHRDEPPPGKGTMACVLPTEGRSRRLRLQRRKSRQSQVPDFIVAESPPSLVYLPVLPSLHASFWQKDAFFEFEHVSKTWPSLGGAISRSPLQEKSSGSSHAPTTSTIVPHLRGPCLRGPRHHGPRLHGPHHDRHQGIRLPRSSRGTVTREDSTGRHHGCMS